MDDFKDWVIISLIGLWGILWSLIAIVLIILAIASPFIAIGLGLGVLYWSFCLFVPFC